MPGKFDSARDEVLYTMALEGWANDSDGESAALTGWFARLTQSDAEIKEIREAFEDAAPESFEWSSIVGLFLLRESNEGFVTVTEYATERELTSEFRHLFNAFHSDIDF